MKLQELRDKKILILGFGREGKNTLVFLRKLFPQKKIGIADQKLHKNYLSKIKNYDVVIKTPGIPLRKIAPYLKKGQIVTSQTEIFFAECPGTIVGITGTKGKSTTASLIHHMLKKGGVRSHLIGNIGEPVLSYLKKVPLRGISHRETRSEDVFVYELSSFQLESLKSSPHIAVLLNLYQEHLDHHGSFAKYVRAKANIARFQSKEDFLIYNRENKITKNIAKLSRAQKLPFSAKEGQPLLCRGGTVPPIVASTAPAFLVGKLFGVPDANIKQAIKSFKPLPHRLERIGKHKGIVFYNDSLATIPEATIAAIDALGPGVHTLIAGGYDRGIDMKKLAGRIKKSKVQALILFPETGKKILAALKKKPVRVFFAKNMGEAVRLAFLHTPKNKICLLSPAASSFNMFRDYRDRGDQFKKLVKQYGR